MAIVFERNGMVLQVSRWQLESNYSNPGLTPEVAEALLDQIGQWCYEHRCGRRTSYDMFEFRKEQDITAFLLKWG